ncbi:MAG: hypothetical protein HKN12_00460, partial [Gemmatimonadetes bacterium]|nr:hypothetical protein [Gemmatimonadota bacterium]
MDAETVDRHYLEATEHLLRGRPDRAVTLLERVPEAARTAEHALALGKALLDLGRPADAECCLR